MATPCDDTKTFIHAFLYGAGPILLSALLIPDGAEAQKKRAGLAMRKRFLTRTPAIKQLIDNPGLKGSTADASTVRSKHSVLNLIFTKRRSAASQTGDGPLA